MVMRKKNSNRGGFRANAGRKKGSGKQHLLINKDATGRRLEKVTKDLFVHFSKPEDITPLDFMLMIMRNEDVPLKWRFNASVAAAPYVHAKLSNVTHTIKKEGDLQSLIESIKQERQKMLEQDRQANMIDVSSGAATHSNTLEGNAIEI